jgi:asparagine synthase (glutamine-hydrolysing)
MCGIAGIVGAESGFLADAAEVHRMCQTIVHRGPDDEGIYAEGPAALGMRRLSIIDLSTGHQPIHNEDGSLWIVFNGEIYNFPELRAELEAQGHRFYTNTDTEAIVHAYEQHGADCVQKLRGMFAFALWDRRHRRLFLARDRFGKKPLYYAVSEGRLLFGSEIKALLAAAPELAEVDPNGVLSFFYFGYIPDPLTAFKRIRKLAPGHWLEFSEGRIRTAKYWELPRHGVYNPESEGECLEELEQRLAEAVRVRLVSDVPLGALLSGGVDSSLVVALMARASSRPVQTFSIGFSNADFNETDYARVVAHRFGAQHRELIIDPQIEETVHALTRSLEEPFGDSSMVPTYHVCRLARQHVTVALAGDGGDELFAGYDRYKTHLGRRMMRPFLPGLGMLYRKCIHPRIPTGWRGRRFLYNLSLPGSERYLDGVSILPAGERDRSIFSDEYLAWADRQSSPYEWFRAHLAESPATDALSELQYLDAKTYLSGDILTKVDRMSMATSLEVRAPFLDHEFAEWAAQLSPKWKLRASEPKYILKKLAERLGIPKHVIYRRKQGFSMPLVHWFRQSPSPALLEMLNEARTIDRGYFSPKGLRQRLSEHRAGRRDHAWELWHLIIFELWHRNFLEALPRRASTSECARLESIPALALASRSMAADARGLAQVQ